MISLGAIVRDGLQSVHMVFAHHSLDYPDLKRLAYLAYQLFDEFCNFCRQHLLAIFRDRYKLVLNLKERVTPLSIDHFRHSAPTFS